MTTTPEISLLGRALVRGDVAATGAYRVDVATQRWWWSDETYRIHGFEPGEVVPTTELVLAHKHPQDRDRVRDQLGGIAGSGLEPFGSLHRIVDARGAERLVCMVGEPRSGEHGPEVHGTVADLTGPVARHAARRADVEIEAAARSRRDIEQAKAVLALVLDLDDDEAFALLRQHSNHANVAVRELALRVLRYAHAAQRQGRLDASALLAQLAGTVGSPDDAATAR
ncbi:PAS and ANTAR domain-containing protein [Isoptericola dokdonensis]|uniref:ANTAR domain protein n=1 Tax=Isoptericola dokdonensis DS-3 TaxID=1300344 RepID=A0A161IIK0_9MICO|nr:PAS and ANTAR domain-containing protein [Isoptericola dokdonensis]ANC29900.1 ANTAR domain protein [Isoptericola dokdonensis DS-3]